MATVPSLRSPSLQAISWAIVASVLMLLPGEALPPLGGWLPFGLDAWIDKVAHMVVFLVLAILVSRALRVMPRIRLPVTTAILLTFFYASLLEVAQIPLSGRSWEAADLLADALGVLLAVPFASK